MGRGDEAPMQKKICVQIPSVQDVLDNNQSESLPSLFRPSANSEPEDPKTFSQAFSFVKNTEFYSPPPPQTTSSNPSSSSTDPQLVSRQGNRKFPPASAPVGQNGIVVGQRQQGNPLLKYIKNVRWTYGDIVPDYLLGQNTCALYISLRYHLLHPDYIYYRIRELQKSYRLRIILCHIDVDDVVKPLHEVIRTAVLHDCTLICGWSLQECARYLETIKAYENKPADMIQGVVDNDYLSRLTSVLTTVRRVNKSDVVTLGANFGTLAGVMGASMEELARCPGIGERKVKRLYDTFHEPFRRVVRTSNIARNVEKSTQENNDSSQTTTEIERAEPDNNKVKDPEISVRSALEAAYAKYWNRFGVNNKGEKITPGKNNENDNLAEDEAQLKQTQTMQDVHEDIPEVTAKMDSKDDE